MAEYFDVDHAREVAALETRWSARTEWPTWLLIVAIHGGWAAVLLLVGAGRVPLGAGTPVLVVLCAWHMSLQHELLHGHPTRWPRLNQLLGSVPLAVWFPYTLYRESHLEHHRDEGLTVPGFDPETNYVLPERWVRMPGWRRALWHARKTLLGRIVVGPPMSVAAMLIDASRAVRRGDYRHVPMWLGHIAAVIALLACVQRYAGVPWWWYLLAVAWPALGLSMVRSLYEHRAATHPKARTVINEAGALLRLLYLNNNYHLVHHDLPRLPWFHLPRAYRMRRDAYRSKCGGFVIEGYRELFERYAWRQTDAPIHPFGRHGQGARLTGGARIGVASGRVLIST